MPDHQSRDHALQAQQELAGRGQRCARQHQREFLAAETGEQVFLAQFLHDRSHHGDEHHVAGLVAIGVVDRFEMVDVEQRNGQP
nr:hypothetical protein [uncultured Noviherbaspirillum sp.]